MAIFPFVRSMALVTPAANADTWGWIPPAAEFPVATKSPKRMVDRTSVAGNAAWHALSATDKANLEAFLLTL